MGHAQYLVVIYGLAQSKGVPVATGQIAQELERSPSATTEMIQRLEIDGFVEHEPYTGVYLTETGRERAQDLYESHQTLCRFFRDVLNLEEYEQEALELAGTVSPTVTQRLASTVIPHGSVEIPMSDSNADNDLVTDDR